MGLTAVGVGLKEIVLSDFSQTVDPAGAWVLIGALSLVFLSVAALDLVTKSRHFGVRDRDRVIWRLVAVALLIGLGLVAPLLTTTVFAALVALIVVAQIAIEAYVAKRADAAIRVDVDRIISSPQPDARCEHLADIADVKPTSAGCKTCIWNERRIVTVDMLGRVGIGAWRSGAVAPWRQPRYVGALRRTRCVPSWCCGPVLAPRGALQLPRRVSDTPDGHRVVDRPSPWS